MTFREKFDLFYIIVQTFFSEAEKFKRGSSFILQTSHKIRQRRIIACFDIRTKHKNRPGNEEARE